MTSPDPRLPALPSRRTIARGAAWAAPVVALGAAAPAYAATPMPPSCPTCLKPKQSYFIMGGIAANWIVPDLAFAAPLSIDTSACQSLIGDGFLAAFAFTVTDVKLRMSNGATYTSTTGLGGGAGILGQPTVMPGPSSSRTSGSGAPSWASPSRTCRPGSPRTCRCSTPGGASR